MLGSGSRTYDDQTVDEALKPCYPWPRNYGIHHEKIRCPRQAFDEPRASLHEERIEATRLCQASLQQKLTFACANAKGSSGERFPIIKAGHRLELQWLDGIFNSSPAQTLCIMKQAL